MILSLFVFVVASAEAISNYKELLAFAKAVNKEADISMWLNENGVVCFDADIDMKKGKKFPTIQKFNGVIDGCGHKLYNWNAKCGLIRNLESKGVVKNLTIDNTCLLTVKTAMNDKVELVYFFVGVNRGQIINCVNKGTIEHFGEEAYKQIYIGSIAALNYNIVHKCKNSGNISSRFSFTKHAKGMSLRQGGLVGTCYGKSLSGATISYCENTGNVSFMGDYPNNNIGGIVGEASKLTVKSCINRGSVVAVGMPITTPKVKGYCRVGGISGWSNNDILCCDNFGAVSVSGAHEAWVAGIIARPNSTMNIVGCNNYGKITGNVSLSSYVGGIFAFSIINPYLCNCANYGAVTNENAKAPGWAGGIGAVLQSRKGLTRGGVLRDCVNYAPIVNKSTHKHACTAGVLGYGSGRADKDKPVVTARVIDCGNYGKISSAVASRTKSIAGVTRNCDVVGERYDDMAKAVKPLQNGMNIYGRIIDDNGMPVEGIVVSDGEQCVKSDVNGEYQMKSDMKKVRFVTISLPSAYEMPLRENRPQFFRRVIRYSIAARADFVLKKREKPTDNFVVAMIGDPQTRGLKTDKAVERFDSQILDDLNAFNHKSDKEVYAICLGDLVYNWMWAYDDYLDVLKKSSVPMISVIGNHDFDQRTLFSTDLGTPYFEAYLAPENYSFNIGKMHFVVVNSILYNRPTDKHNYKTGLDNKTLKWLENDLAHVSKETPIVICSHAPLFKRREAKINYNEKSVNYKKYTALLSKYDKVYAWAGHTHQNYATNYANEPEKYSSLKNIESVIVGRCIGMIRLNRELNTCGTPNGYMVAEVNGGKMEWYYKSVGSGRQEQIRAYSPTRTNTEYVKANIWNHSPNLWSTPEWWENGVKVADMEPSKNDYDPDYLKIYAEHNEEKLGKTERKYSMPAKSPYLFRVKPSEGVRSGEIRVTDNFGVTYVKSVTW